MPGIVPGIHALSSDGAKTCMAGTSPAMTSRSVCFIWPMTASFCSVTATVFLKAAEMTATHDHPHSHDHDERWKHDGVRVIPGNQLDPNVPSTAGMDRKAAINFARVGAQ